jgi:flagellar L-ring protein precursor FlgH
MNRAIPILSLAFLVALGAVPAAAQQTPAGNPGSLWGGGNLLAEKGFSRHDLVTIVIRESAKTGTKMDTTYDRSTSVSLEVAKAFDLKTDKGGLGYKPLTATSKKPEIDLKGERTHEGSGEIKSDTQFSARITAEVIEILPNGQLVLEARKRVKIGEETSNLVLTGRIRPEDVASDNTVQSDRVADPHIQYNPEGAVADANKRSWLTRIFDFLNIF